MQKQKMSFGNRKIKYIGICNDKSIEKKKINCTKIKREGEREQVEKIDPVSQQSY
jgi:hypothetical protein